MYLGFHTVLLDFFGQLFKGWYGSFLNELLGVVQIRMADHGIQAILPERACPVGRARRETAAKVIFIDDQAFKQAETQDNQNH